MKRMKLIVAIVCLGLFGHIANAQDSDKLNQAIELYNKSITAFGENNHDSAIQQANEALGLIADAPEGSEELKANLEKTIPKYYYGKASEQLRNKDFVKAIVSLEEAISIAAKYKAEDIAEDAKAQITKVNLALAGSEFGAKNFEKAIEYAAKVIAIDSADAKAYLIKGTSHLQKGDVADAEASLLKSAELSKAAGKDDDANKAVDALSKLFLKEASNAQKAKKMAATLENANKSLKYQESTNGYKLKGVAAISLKKWDEAIAAYSKLATDPKEAAAANYKLGESYVGKGNKAKACEYFKKVGNDATYKVPAEQQMKINQCK